MSKNKYILPFKDEWYVEYGGIKKSDSHSWDIISQRYAYDFEIRKDNLPYHDDYKDCNNYYSYLQEVICPCDGWIIEVVDKYDNTRILEDRPIICDVDNPYGNHIIIKHKNNEYSVICHLEKNSIKVKEGDIVSSGDLLGLVGNSGNTQGPHIHFHVQDSLNINSKGVKITFKDVISNNKKVKYIKNKMFVKNKNGN